ncbi:AraC family transcriptional regulator [Isoalcanivorax indicus]|uniref:AraC family transcriptional regulator n=1 Tax=Isoalcanivorax indicus TaxID=2202653 RepID=UPI000DB933BD|nr:AraC family transcriptional regulator [Isoalcanivorax indicus]
MLHTSNWPLPAHGERVLLPRPLTDALARHPLSRDCHPLAFGYYPSARGHQMARQTPEDHLVIYCVEGVGWATCGEHRETVQPGDMLLLPAGQPHAYGASSANPWSLYWMHLGGDRVPDLFQHVGLTGRCTVGLHERLVSDFRALLALARGGYRETAFLHGADLCRSLLSYAALLRQRASDDNEGHLDLDRLHHLMASQLDTRPTLADLARAAGQRSPWQFIRRYRALTGQTPMQAFLHRKIERACYLLDVSDLTVADIARQLGYDDPYYFSRLFRKITGVSPQRYRVGGA